MVLPFLFLLGCESQPEHYDINKFDPVVGAEFRDNARTFLSELNPDCELTKHRESVGRLEELQKGWSDLKAEQQAKKLAIDIAISEADHRYELTNRPPTDCPIPDTDGTDPRLKEHLQKLTMLLTGLQEIARELTKQQTKTGS